MRRIVLILLFTALFSQVTAQNDTPEVTPTLAKLDAKAYIQAIYDNIIKPALLICPFDLYTACHEQRMLANEIMFRYEHLDVPYDLLSKVYRRLIDSTRWEDEAVQWWTEQLIIAWLRDYPVNLNDMRSFTTSLFIVETVATIQPDDPAETTWVLDVNIGERSFDGLIILQRHAQYGYQSLSHPVLLTRPGQFHEWERTWGSFFITEIADINGDGTVEIMAIRNVRSANEGSIDGRYYILEWQNGELVDLFAEPMRYSEVNTLDLSRNSSSMTTKANKWEILEDASGQLVRHTYYREDNFKCVMGTVREYVWQNGQFVWNESPDRREYADTPACKFRQAEELSWAGHYAQAIPLYRTFANEVASRSSGIEKYIAPDRVRTEKLSAAYAYYRMGIAHIMLGQTDEAESAFKYARTISDDPNLHILLDAVHAVRDPEAKCAVAQTFFARDEINRTALRYFGKLYFQPGMGRFFSPTEPPPDSLLAGCNIDFNPIVPTPTPDFSSVPATPLPPEPTAVPVYPTSRGDSLLSNLHTQSPEDVLAAIDAVLQRQPDSPEALYERAFMLELLGRDSEAAEAYARVPEQEYHIFLRFLADLNLGEVEANTP